jgi:hypothetical protein
MCGFGGEDYYPSNILWGLVLRMKRWWQNRALFLHTILASNTFCYTLVRLRSHMQPKKNAKPKPRRATKDNHGNS